MNVFMIGICVVFCLFAAISLLVGDSYTATGNFLVAIGFAVGGALGEFLYSRRNRE